MRISWEYIAGFFDGEGCVGMSSNRARPGTIAAASVTLSQSGSEGCAILTKIQDFLGAHGIRGYISTSPRPNGHRTMHNLRIMARPSVEGFLRAMLPRVSVKRVVVQDTLRFYRMYPSLRGAVTIEQNKARGKYGAVLLDVAQLRVDLAELKTRGAVAAKYGVSTYTIKKYLDPEYRKRYDAYRKQWRAQRQAVA